MLRLTLVDDHRMFREGLRLALEREPDLRVVAEAGGAREALEVLSTVPTDVVLLDVMLPDAGGFALARELRRRDASRKIVLITTKAAGDVEAEARAIGANALVSQEQPVSELVGALRAIAAGRTIPGPVAAPALYEPGRRAEPGPVDRLSPREREVFDLVLRGLTNEVIGEQLAISRRTVETHRAHILQKLGLHTVAEVFRFAARHGLLRE